MFQMWKVLVLSGALSVGGEFFHELSRTELRPPGHDFQNSDFGFSIAYQDAPPSLVVGAPKQDFVGKVYNCSLENLSKYKDCSVIDMTSLNIETDTKEIRKKLSPNQNYFFGSSIAATTDYFVTCAPLMTKTTVTSIKVLPNRGGRTKVLNKTSDIYGGCYLYDNIKQQFSTWKDNAVKLENIWLAKKRPSTRITDKMFESGGLGWNILADTVNELLLVAKTGMPGDILSVHMDKPLEPSKSLLEDHDELRDFSQYFNTGHGMAVGSFFNKAVILYAVSVQHIYLKGKIYFLENTGDTLSIMLDPTKNVFRPYFIDDKTLGSMFGAALAAVDFNQDGLSELLVGAPAMSPDNYKREFGALHIYIGGDVLSRNDKSRLRTILGKQENSRFGSAIATSDIDGDNIPEIFVSAPYENNEFGVVYVLSGFELQQIVTQKQTMESTPIELASLKLTQKLRGDDGARHFGHSLRVIRDIDDNGCDELAIGSPANSTVRVLRCLPTVIASTILTPLGDKIVKEDATSFQVQVCLNVTVREKCNKIEGSIEVASQATGDTTIRSPKFKYDLTSEKEQKLCEIISVQLNKHESAEYIFSTSIKMLDTDNNGHRRTDKDYRPWAVLSYQSALESSIVVKRYCIGTKCEPKLQLEFTWTGSEAIDTESTVDETFTMRVNNTGGDAKTAFVRLWLQGARISPHQGQQCFKENGTDFYSCALPNPLKRDNSFDISVQLDTTEPTNVPALNITAQLHDEVFKEIVYTPIEHIVAYHFNTNSVIVKGSNHNLTVTDKDMEDDDNIVTLSDNHEYHIVNNGPVTWHDLIAVLEITNELFIENVTTVTTEVCEQQSLDEKKITFHCMLTLKQGADITIVASINISKKSIESVIGDGNLETRSILSLMMYPTEDVNYQKLSTHLYYQEILSVGNNLLLIAIIVVIIALVLLVLITFILYKCGFFKRAEKKRLHVLRESVRKRSIRKASQSIGSPKPSANDENHCDIEVVDDCVFQDVDITPQGAGEVQSSKDDIVLINEKAEVHPRLC